MAQDISQSFIISFSGPQESCQVGMFTCSNKVCVEPNRVCDYSDDCGDGTDEELCGMTVGYSWVRIKYNVLSGSLCFLSCEGTFEVHRTVT